MDDEIKPISLIWDDNAKEDLKHIYIFNKKVISLEYAKKIRTEIYEAVGEIVFLRQWQEDEVLGDPYRRIIIGNYKIAYLVKENKGIYILMVFDSRQDPAKYTLKNR